jgi:transposase
VCDQAAWGIQAAGEMLVVETVARIRRAHFSQGKSIKAISRELGIARNTIRRVLRSGETSFAYEREVQPRPRLAAWTEDLERRLTANEKLSRRERLGLIRVYEDLRGVGYEGGYDAVRRYARARESKRGTALTDAYVPLSFAPGEAYQFDWSHEIVVLAGATTIIKVAQVRLCHSRMPFICAYPRETQEMVFDAHQRAFAFFRGACQRGIYDNMRTAVDAVFVGKDRAFNRRFLQMCSHYLVEPTACTPASGWEKGQVENQVNVVRERFFKPRLRSATYAEMNAWLLERCVAKAKIQPHPECRDRSVWEMFEAERPHLVRYVGPFDGFHAKTASVSKTCLVQFDKNRYSVMSRAVGRPVEVHAYAERIVIRQDGQIVADHARCFGHEQTIYDPWHYVPVLARKPGAMRNGAPFKGWVLPGAVGRVRQKLRSVEDGDRQMVKILTAVLADGLPAVEAACAEALNAGLCSSDVVLNALSRQRQPALPPAILVPHALALRHEPVADCARYDTLRRLNHGTP